jgi:hypothetical protein
MNDNKFDELWQIYSDTSSEEEQYALMKEFMLSSSLEDLLAWNRFLAEKGDKMWTEHRKAGLSDSDKEWYKAQFAQFDDLISQIQMKRAA